MHLPLVVVHVLVFVPWWLEIFSRKARFALRGKVSATGTKTVKCFFKDTLTGPAKVQEQPRLGDPRTTKIFNRLAVGLHMVGMAYPL